MGYYEDVMGYYVRVMGYYMGKSNYNLSLYLHSISPSCLGTYFSHEKNCSSSYVIGAMQPAVRCIWCALNRNITPLLAIQHSYFFCLRYVIKTSTFSLI